MLWNFFWDLSGKKVCLSNLFNSRFYQGCEASPISGVGIHTIFQKIFNFVQFPIHCCTPNTALEVHLVQALTEEAWTRRTMTRSTPTMVVVHVWNQFCTGVHAVTRERMVSRGDCWVPAFLWVLHDVLLSRFSRCILHKMWYLFLWILLKTRCLWVATGAAVLPQGLTVATAVILGLARARGQEAESANRTCRCPWYSIHSPFSVVTYF